MAHDWGHIFRQTAEAVFTPDPFNILGLADTPQAPVPVATVPGANVPVAGGLGPQSCEGMVWQGGTPPKGFKVVYWCGQGVLRKVRRRRRRRILTASDKADISYIISTAGKGQLAASLIHKSTH